LLLPQLIKAAIGRCREDGSIAVEAGEPQGCFLSGPFCELPAGAYLLEVRCRVGTPRAASVPVLGVEAIARGKGQLAWCDLTAEELRSGSGAIAFVVPADPANNSTMLNFRLCHFGAASLVITAVDLLRVSPATAPERLRRWRLISRLRTRKSVGRQQDGTARVGRGRSAGCVLDGPASFHLPQGRYQLKLGCSAGLPEEPGRPVLGVDIIAGENHRQAWRDFTAEELAHGAVAVDFVVPDWLAEHTGNNAPFSFDLYHLGNAEITIRRVDLHELLQDCEPAVAPPTWRLLARLRRRPWVADFAVRSIMRGAFPAPRLLCHVHPRLRLAAGQYRLRVSGKVLRTQTLTRPAIRLDVVMQGAWHSPRAVRWLMGDRRWWFRGDMALLATRQFTGAELNAGECALAFDVPTEWGMESGERVWFDIRIATVSAASTHIHDVRLDAVAANVAVKRASSFRPFKSLAARPARKNVIIVGNCQAEALAAAFRTAPLIDRFSVRYQYVDASGHDLEEGKRIIGEADVVLVQDISNWNDCPLRNNVRDQAELLKFPCLRFASLWPFDGTHGPGDPEAAKHDWPQVRLPYFPYKDGALARMRKETPDPEARFARYAALQMKPIINVHRLHALERERLLTMDQQFGCDIGKFILENFQTQRLFHTTTHPRRMLSEMVLRLMLRLLVVNADLGEINDIDEDVITEVPVHPLVGSLLGVKWANEKTRYRFENEQITWETYVRWYINHYG
jgi:hypothetical protein